MLTLHSLGMVGAWFVGSMAGVSYLLLRYTRPSLRISKLNYWGTLLGVVLLIVCTLGGRFGTGWYFLYPLAALFPAYLEPGNYLYVLCRAYHPWSLLDDLVSGHSARDSTALFIGSRAGLELRGGQAGA